MTASTLVAQPETHRSRSAEDHRLLTRYHRDGDQAAREALVERFLPLARHLARRYERGDEPLDDLVQVASIGLLKAIERFDPERGTAFSTFAMPTILGEIKRHFRDRGWALRVPRSLKELSLEVKQAEDQLEGELGRPPTVAQVAQRTGAGVEQVLEARLAGYAHHGVSLDRSSEQHGDGDAPTIGDTLATVEPGFARVDDAVTLDRLTSVLTPRERWILHLRFQHDLTQSEIAARVGVSQMQVSRLIRGALDKVRAQA
jgi:RNA polymerase sigma-B factor